MLGAVVVCGGAPPPPQGAAVVRAFIYFFNAVTTEECEAQVSRAEEEMEFGFIVVIALNLKILCLL